jgi:hypothetical protein
MTSGLDSTKTGARPSHEAIESTGRNATGVAEIPQERLDHSAMEMAKRAENQIHADETTVPGNSIFTK